MKNYYKIMLGSKSKYADECLSQSFIGADYSIRTNLSKDLSDDWKQFNHKYIPIYLAANPGKSKIAAGLGCGTLWTVSKGINRGDVVVCPNGRGVLHFGEVNGDYAYHSDGILPHRRSVQWFPATVRRAEVSQEMKNSIGSQGTSAMITKHAEEIERYISGNKGPTIISTDQMIEDPSIFALETHLEEFLIQNWDKTDIGKQYDIYEVDGEIVGRQFKCDTGNIDILAISKDKKELLVIELKKGRASDTVVGQIQRYMGYLKAEEAEDNQIVKGIIIALEDDTRIKRALSVTNNIEFYTYQVSFKLSKG